MVTAANGFVSVGNTFVNLPKGFSQENNKIVNFDTKG